MDLNPQENPMVASSVVDVQCHCETGMSLDWLVQTIEPASTYEATERKTSLN